VEKLGRGLLAVAVGFGVFAGLEVASAAVLSLVLAASNYEAGMDVALRWAAMVLLFVNIRVGVGAKRAFLRRLNTPRTDAGVEL
jgi:hypothetical protein